MTSPFDLTGRVAIVTGASRGLGRAIAIGLAEAGARVVLAGRDVPALESTRSEVAAGGGTAMALEVDVTDRSSVDAMVESSIKEWGQIDILVNNAGVLQLGPFIDLPEAELTRVLDTNLLGTYRCTQAVGRVMLERRRGKVINVSSSAGLRGRAMEVGYSASKGAVNMLTLSLAVEWARYGINVNAVCPGYFETSINEKELRDEQLRATVERRIPLRRIGQPPELAPTVVFLAAPASDYLTGQLIAVDGGTTSK
jgi:2-deoxy-D-gluconate 3-dehydrogenase